MNYLYPNIQFFGNRYKLSYISKVRLRDMKQNTKEMNVKKRDQKKEDQNSIISLQKSFKNYLLRNDNLGEEYLL